MEDGMKIALRQSCKRLWVRYSRGPCYRYFPFPLQNFKIYDDENWKLGGKAAKIMVKMLPYYRVTDD